MEKDKLIQAILAMQDVIEKILDKESGCPWDKEQTPHSLTEYTIEEMFEFVDGVRKDNIKEACDEMGDLVFGVMLIAHKYSEQQKFDFADALMKSVAKMQRRHPHVFNKKEDDDLSKEGLHQTWEKIKNQEKAEKAEKGEKEGALASIPGSLPALSRAYRIHAKAAKAGFTWDDDEDVEKQVEAEWLELLDAKAGGDPKQIEHELGDIIFSLTELGRRMGVKANYATDMTCNRFTRRFEAMEALARERNLDFESLSLDEKDDLWNEIKEKEEE